ncbi:hypothetical protein Pla22_45520 [Rubripirellula amarantea]|uniref:Uncharacterized protein n=1 Tax=Rubripirellula amarantea TaxID=2527999 RepID=A0A5C5WEK5_9BACT|nr:hypothetical protein [Rubripirellula amarantea]TWT49356.1 hypothetical protein Pla22_45520 [Rubripirellula amarantea]
MSRKHDWKQIANISQRATQILERMLEYSHGYSVLGDLDTSEKISQLGPSLTHLVSEINEHRAGLAIVADHAGCRGLRELIEPWNQKIDDVNCGEYTFCSSTHKGPLELIAADINGDRTSFSLGITDCRRNQDVAMSILASLPDGPVVYGVWRHNGHETSEKTTPLSWKLLEYVWSTKSHTCDLADLAGKVWDQSKDITEVLVGNQRREVNRFMRDGGIPLKMSISEGSVMIERIKENQSSTDID